jgi:solute carrier family 6 amino acid transporter-like protein 5/7/9/14
MSVGLGNIWRFPFSALKNGGGAFVIPYLIVLFLVGKPIYFLEMYLGQFYSRGCIKAFDIVPAMRGVGMGQVLSIFTVATYYAPIMAITLSYLYSSFSLELPWGKCNPEWNVTSCVASSDSSNSTTENGTSSATLYFVNDILHSKDSIADGIGLPVMGLVVFLLISWILIFFVMIKGIKSSGKASYVLAIFPYVILIILFIRSVTLPGAGEGLIALFKPDFKAMLNPKVWFEAACQMFFSLAVCFGCITMYSSYNKFDHNLYRDVHIVTLLDTFTSLLAGSTIFGVLGHLKYKTGRDIFKETNGGASIGNYFRK